MSLASRALEAAINRTDRGCKVWLDSEYGREPDDLLFAKPSASALRRWMSRLKKSGMRMNVLVSAAGRRRGHSQLSPEADMLVHECALYFWSRPKLMKIDAYALLEEKVAAHNYIVPADTAVAVPSKQMLYKRIDRLRCFETVAAKNGTKEAMRQFEGSGEGLIVNELLEVVLMDATTLDQTIVFDDDWALPACKVRVVALMDAFSHAIIACHVYAGPDRGEASIEAVVMSMQPPTVDAEALAAMPILAWMFGRGRALLPDNAKTLTGPSTIAAFNEAGIDVLMPPIEMPTAKATLERFFRFLKQALAQLPGTLIDPKRAKEMGYDPVGPCLTLSQLRAVVASVVTQHNISPSRGLDGRSPAAVWLAAHGKRATPVFEDPAHVRRLLGRSAEALLTSNGVEHNGIRYRDAEKVRQLLDNMASSKAGRRRRKDGSETVAVKIRVSPGNLDAIQVYDTLAEEYVTLPSTQPRYTHRLSEWEHREFTRQAKRRNEPHSSETQRLSAKRRTIKLIDELAPKVAFQQRREMAALYLSQQVSNLAGRTYQTPFPIDGVATVPQSSLEAGRADTGLPTRTTTSRTPVPEGHKPPPRPVGNDIEMDDTLVIDWDGVALNRDADDPETGRFPDDDDQDALGGDGA